VVEGSEAVGQAAGLLDEQIDGLGAAVADLVVSKRANTWLRHCRAVRRSRATFGDRAGGERGNDLLGDLPALGRAGGSVQGSQLLVAPARSDMGPPLHSVERRSGHERVVRQRPSWRKPDE
jgi:hypothetical protein